jgi:hypothetical protein
VVSDQGTGIRGQRSGNREQRPETRDQRPERPCPIGVVLGRYWVVFAIKTPLFGLNSTKFDHDFEVVLLMLNELSAILPEKKGNVFI